MTTAAFKTIEVTVSPKGDTKIETRGFSGAECRDASRGLEVALGTRADERLTAEYHATQTQPHLRSQT